MDMGLTFMFDVDRFNVNDDLTGTYLRFGGNRLSGNEVYNIVSNVFEQMVADSNIEENYENFSTLSSYLNRLPCAASLPSRELSLLKEVFAEHEIGKIPIEHINIIKKLHQTHRLGIISDIWSNSDRFYRELEETGIRDFFDTIVFSSDIGIIKPFPKIFSKAFEAFDTDVSKVVYIGDSLRRDVAGARNFGISSIWIGNELTIESDIVERPDFIIADLQDILIDKVY